MITLQTLANFTKLLPRVRRPAPAPAAALLDLQGLVGAEAWARLPLAMQLRFEAAHADTTYAGCMDLRCSRIGGLFAWLAGLFGSPLTRANASAVPTTVRVSGNGRGGVVWERRFHHAGAAGPQTVRSTKEPGPHGSLLERTDGGLAIVLDVFEEGGELVFLSRRFVLACGPLRLPVPALFTPGVCRVVQTDLGQGLFRFTLSMVHPLWGETFHQTGVFAEPSESAP